MNLLFICNQNLNRSKTAEELFRQGRRGFSTQSAGLYNDNPVTEKQLAWADIIVVMEDVQRGELAKRFPKIALEKRVLSLGIPDIYYYMQPELISLLRKKMDDALTDLAIH